MNMRSIIDECRKKSADPRFPGLGKDPKLGFAVGVLLGVLGVGLYLRSLKDGLLCFAACWLLGMLWDSWFTTIACWVLCGCWVTMRISASTQRHEAMRLMTAHNRESSETKAAEPGGTSEGSAPDMVTTST